MFNRKPIVLCALLTLALVLFQNCGPGYNSQSDGLYIGNDYADDDCLSPVVGCGYSADYLQITLDMANPTVIRDATTVPTAADDSFVASGRCNTGEYPDYRILWELRDANNVSVDSHEEAGICNQGKYQITVSATIMAYNVAYTFFVKIIGIGEDGIAYENFNANGSAVIDLNRITVP